MDEQYVIYGVTLDSTADAIRFMTHKTDLLNPLDFPEEILSIDLTTEEYMRISDLLEYPATPNEEWYHEDEIAKVDALIEHFENLGGDTNGE